MRSSVSAFTVVTMIGLALAGAGRLSAQQPTTPPPPTATPPAGTQPAAQEAPAKNPYTGNPDAIAAGKKLYFSWSCYGCHGAGGGGGMGPSLIDTDWRYGGTDADVFHTIKFGRPNGMPAWGDKLSDDDIWHVMAYVRSLYKGDPAKVVW